MQIGMIGLGRMGANMARRLLRSGHEVVGFDHFAEAVDTLTHEGAVGARSIDELVKNLAVARHLADGPCRHCR